MKEPAPAFKPNTFIKRGSSQLERKKAKVYPEINTHK